MQTVVSLNLIETQTTAIPPAPFTNQKKPRSRWRAKAAPGEVSDSDLSNAIQGTSKNTNAVGTLDTPFADPDVETLRQKLDELINVARR